MNKCDLADKNQYFYDEIYLLVRNSAPAKCRRAVILLSTIGLSQAQQTPDLKNNHRRQIGHSRLV